MGPHHLSLFCWFVYFINLKQFLRWLLKFAGADTKGTIRSLALPNLDGVTRQAAKEYFDNSWTLYETLFAGLKGEEGFYR